MKKRFGFLISLVILALLIYVLKDVDFAEVYQLLLAADLSYLFLAVIFLAGSFFVWDLRWQISLKTLVNADYLFLLKVLMAGVFLNNITPGTGIGGEPLRAYYLDKKYGKGKSKFLGVILADKFFNYAVYLVFVVLSLLFIFLFLDIGSNLKILFESLIVVIFVAGIFAIFFSRKRGIGFVLDKVYQLGIFKKFRNKEAFKKYVKKRIDNFKRTFGEVVWNKKIFFFGIILSFSLWILTYLSSYFLFLSFGNRVSFLVVVIVVSIGYLAGDLSPMPGGIGLMEGTMFLLYSAMGVGASLAVVVSLLSRIIYYFFSLAVGGVCFILLKKEIK